MHLSVTAARSRLANAVKAKDADAEARARADLATAKLRASVDRLAPAVPREERYRIGQGLVASARMDRA